MTIQQVVEVAQAGQDSPLQITQQQPQVVQVQPQPQQAAPQQAQAQASGHAQAMQQQAQTQQQQGQQAQGQKAQQATTAANPYAAYGYQGMVGGYNMTPEQGEEILDFMYANKMRLREMSLRMALKIADLRKLSPLNWKRLAETTCMKAAD